jgi:pimeloyl-ACP methyl ester carboxylesterase
MHGRDRIPQPQAASPVAESAPASDPQLFSHHFVHVEGVRVHWTELGQSTENPPLILLHGLNDCGRTWRHVAPRLSRDRRVVMPDLPGHGLSGRPDASYAPRWYGRIAAQWLAAAGLERADVVGHSFGGGVAQTMLLECPERLHRLVLVSSGGLGRGIAFPLRLASIPLAVELLGQPFMGPCTRLALRATGDVRTGEELARLCVMNAQRGSARAFARTVRHVIDWRGQRLSFFEHAHEMSVLPPIAIFWGDRDRIIPFSHAEALAEFLEGVRITRFKGCGHYLHHEKPDAFVAALRDVLGSR